MFVQPANNNERHDPAGNSTHLCQPDQLVVWWCGHRRDGWPIKGVVGGTRNTLVALMVDIDVLPGVHGVNRSPTKPLVVA